MPATRPGPNPSPPARTAAVARWRTVRARPRLFIAVALALLVAWCLPPGWVQFFSTVAVVPPGTGAGEAAQQVVREMVAPGLVRGLVAWNTGAVLYVVLAVLMMLRSDDSHIRLRARQQDDGARVLLLLAALATVACLVAIVGLLVSVHGLANGDKLRHLALAGLTVVSAWAFLQVMFTLHYAHDHYAALAQGLPPPLLFAGEEAPTYGDFFYVAAVIGTSGQTADVALASRAMRRIGALHCILAYLFNTTVLGLLVNISAGLF
ncbi:MAG: hypothetical protein CFE45_26855 [Burkholderiales bacterium PBB5]|nr:MAG: hypothetical protein CFE45_26855 [Burkholderiales bacterium PBB5]